MTVFLRGLYAIADSQWLPAGTMVNAVHAAIKGGARIIQFRDKRTAPDEKSRHQPVELDSATRARLARELAVVCGQLDVPLIINDDVALAASCGAHGVHLGRHDTDVRRAREMLGSHAIIGVSCYNEIGRARTAAAEGADYVAFGRFFPSRTKPHAATASLDLLKQARREIRIPVIAIGGITPENGGTLLECGADALAVVEGVFGQADIRAAAEKISALFTT